MSKGRLEAFSDGVIAILITIMVLELHAPLSGEWSSLVVLVPSLLSYVLSFVLVGIYWNNHHHTFQAADQIDGRVLWANLHLLFWLSLIPFATSWLGEHHYGSAPNAAYGAVLFMCGVAYSILIRALISANGPDSRLARAIGGDRKGYFSLLLYALAIPSAFITPWLAQAFFVTVAIIWFVPDRRIEQVLMRGNR